VAQASTAGFEGRSMAIKGIFYVHAYASDLARSKKFYAETLGWKLTTDEQHVAGLAFGSGYLVLVAHPGKESEAAKGSGGMYLEVQVEDASAEHARLKNLGVQVSELQDQPWGERNFSFYDPDGYLWYYGQSTSAR
jgi:catechol 2,3-dioxygenase-like lactoylglutathione lyase family enzyme